MTIFITCIYTLVACNQVHSTDQRFINFNYVPFTWEELNERAAYIVEGEPIEIVNETEENVLQNTGQGIPFTIFLFKVTKVHKGDTIDEFIEIKQEGNSDVHVKRHPLMELNAKYFLFLKEVDGVIFLLGGPASKYQHIGEQQFVNTLGKMIEIDGKSIQQVNP